MKFTKTQLTQFAAILTTVANLYTLRGVKRARGVAAITRESGAKWITPSGELFCNANLGDVADFWDKVQSNRIVAVSPYGAIVMTCKAQGVDHKPVCDYLKTFIVPPYDNIGDFNENTENTSDVIAVLQRAITQAQRGYDERAARATLNAASSFWR